MLRTIYKSFADDPDMVAMLLDVPPPVVSFHFGVPPRATIQSLKKAGIFLIATATSLAEARVIELSGIDVIVAQGKEAGGHRGVFDPDAPDDALGTSALTRLLVERCDVPIIAAGGIMDGAGIATMLDLGAVAAQLGTAFIACPESGADEAYRTALSGPGAAETCFTALISGRPARTLPNCFTAMANDRDCPPPLPPDYPIAYDAAKALHAVAKAYGENGFGAYWAGEGATRVRTMPASQLIATLREELVRLRPGL